MEFTKPNEKGRVLVSLTEIIDAERDEEYHQLQEAMAIAWLAIENEAGLSADVVALREAVAAQNAALDQYTIDVAVQEVVQRSLFPRRAQ